MVTLSCQERSEAKEKRWIWDRLPRAGRTAGFSTGVLGVFARTKDGFTYRKIGCLLLGELCWHPMPVVYKIGNQLVHLVTLYVTKIP